MIRPGFLEDPLVDAVLQALLKRADLRAPPRIRPPRIRLDEEACPVWFGAIGGEAKAFSWKRLLDLEQATLIVVRVKHRHADAPWRDEPAISLTSLGEERLREWLGHPFPEPSANRQWRAAVSARAGLTDTLRQALLVRPLLIGRRDPQDVLSRLLSAHATFGRAVRRRVVSAKAFWGLSKVLDQRDDLLRALEGQDGEVWPRRTLLMHVRATVPTPEGILFVENLDAFDAACLGEVPLPDTWWILYAAGFKGSSSRLLTNGAVRWFSEVETDRLTSAQLHQGLEQVNQGVCEAAFWGDLDFAGITILRELRRVMPSVQAWKPGYTRLLALLETGQGHEPEESTKAGQLDPERTGCPYSDEVLLPAMRRHRKFVDQEAVCLAADWMHVAPLPQASGHA